jgi:uncharacterized protein YjiS (DUF1127 family)
MSFWARIVDVIQKNQERRVARWQIENMSERQLNDLGLSKAQLRAMLEI